jgi:hypothetical protein
MRVEVFSCRLWLRRRRPTPTNLNAPSGLSGEDRRGRGAAATRAYPAEASSSGSKTEVIEQSLVGRRLCRGQGNGGGPVDYLSLVGGCESPKAKDLRWEPKGHGGWVVPTECRRRRSVCG